MPSDDSRFMADDEIGWGAPYPGPFFGAAQIGDAEIEAVTAVLRSKSLFRYYGSEVLGMADRFERDLATFIGVRHALGVTSGTAGLKTAIAAMAIGPGSEVIVPAYTFVATANAVLAMGARPIFADLDETMSLSVEDVERRITRFTRAVIAVHLQGQAAPVDRLRALCDAHGIALIEDCAQACGTTLGGRPVGSFGHMSAFSFQQGKLLSSGEGGAIVTDDDQLIERARIFHDQGGARVPGSYPRFDQDVCFFGENLRMSEITAAIAGVQLQRLPALLAALRATKKRLLAGLAETRIEIRPTHDAPGDAGCSLCVYLPDLQTRDRWLESLSAAALGVSALYRRPVPLEQLYRDARYHYGIARVAPWRQDIWPVAESLADRSLWLPLPPGIGLEGADRIVAIIAATERLLGRSR
jgi:8-amino-3,8-dideoxy-alpha-D-manno-octulosonate transaminase